MARLTPQRTTTPLVAVASSPDACRGQHSVHALHIHARGLTLLCAGLGLAAPPSTAQSTPGARTGSATAAALLRPPSEARLATGMPGPKYWQNQAVYTIEARLDTAQDILRGTLTLQYTNHSPDTLPVLWLQVPPQAALAVQQGGAGPPVALHLERVPRPPEGSPLVKVLLATPLAPGGTAMLTVKWGELMRPESSTRPTLGRPYHLNAWYPRVRVYDDVGGWDTLTTPAEQQYLDVADYTVALTLPARYLVAATGMLDNAAEVLTAPERERLAAAAQADTVVPIVTVVELQQGTARPTSGGMLTWKFHAQNVRDFGWLASQQYRWDATSWHGTLVQALYPSDAVTWEPAARWAKEALQAYATQWLPYPYSQLTVVFSSLGVSMSYGMLATVNDYVDPGIFSGVLTHAVAHQWLGQLVGSNGRREPWLSEGLNAFWNTFEQARHDPAAGDQMALAGQDLAKVEQYVSEERDEPLRFPVGQPDASVDGYRDYERPAAMLELLRREVLGPAIFDSAVRTYLRAWQGKHATAADFMRTVDQVAGQPLDWFWPAWLTESPSFDPAIAQVAQTPHGAGSQLVVTYQLRGGGRFPLVARARLSDGTTHDLRVPATAWVPGKAAAPASVPTPAAHTATYTTMYTATYTFPAGHVTRLELDPDHRLLDTDRSNNTWTAP